MIPGFWEQSKGWREKEVRGWGGGKKKNQERERRKKRKDRKIRVCEVK